MAECCVLKKKIDEQTLAVFEKKTLRRIYWPIQQDGVWRKRNNNELYAKYNDIIVVRFAKINRLRWAGYIQTMDDERTAKIIMKHKPIGEDWKTEEQMVGPGRQ